MAEESQPKYEKPKILLIDIPVEAEKALTSKGFNVSVASFGKPYKTSSDQAWQPVRPNSVLPPHFGEQEIVVINLHPDEVLESLCGEDLVIPSEYRWFMNPTRGLIDPRPWSMSYALSNFDRILLHGGIFVIFADARDRCSFMQESDKHFFYADNWSFLSVLDPAYINVRDDSGTEIMLPDELSKEDPVVQFVSKYLEEGSYRCTFSASGYHPELQWLTLAVNKYKQAVGVMIRPPKPETMGVIFLLPHVKDKTRFLDALFSDLLPNHVPHLFPDIVGKRWMHGTPYELPEVTELKEGIERIHEEAKQQEAELRKQIDSLNTANAYLTDILTESGIPLVKAVETLLKNLRFKSVINVDEQNAQAGSPEGLREDLQIRDGSPVLLIEVKGISGLPKDEDALTVIKYLHFRMQQEDRTDFQGLTIINHQKNLPGLDRDEPFRGDVVDNAVHHKIGLLTTWDLFRLARSFLKNGWKHEDVKELFYAVGRITLIPRHYTPLGHIAEFWQKSSALGIWLEEDGLKVGDRIGFELPTEFEEQIVESMQIDSQPVNEARAGQEIGISTHLNKHQARKGIRVFLVESRLP